MHDLTQPSPSPPREQGIFRGPWPQRLAFVVEMMREMSRQSDPQVMVQNYGARMRQIFPSDGSVSLSRRGLNRPDVRVTRSHTWTSTVNPWKTRERVILSSGLLSDLIWNEQPTIIDDLSVPSGDPSAPYLHGMRSLTAMPMYDGGVSINMVVALSKSRGAFQWDQLPERVWMTNLFGRATHNLVLSEELKQAYEAVDRELQTVADMQRSLLPRELPKIPGLALAAHYQTSRRAGGDYYDFFELPGGRWGILIADVSGHGTPAAVMMAVTHSIAHTHTGPPTPPSLMLKFINSHLVARYTTDGGSFVTALYAIYDPATRAITYSSAGHMPPRLKRDDGSMVLLDQASALPLGINPQEEYLDATQMLHPGDALVLYTDGITESRKPDSADLFGEARLDAVLAACKCDPETITRNILLAVEAFTDSAAPMDDMTLLVAKVKSSD